MRPPLPPGPFLIAGLARSGRAAALALRARDEEVTGVDAGRVDAAAIGELEAAGATVDESTDGVARLDGVRTLVKSPGVPQDAQVVRAARERGVLVIGELELGWRLLPNEIVAITGSNGKTTTSELVGQIHREAGIPVAVAGNVGTALTTLPGTLDPAAVVVCEASSFQLEDTVAFAPEAAVLLNLAPDHLDRHGTFEAYRDAKLRIFAEQEADAIAVVPAGLDVPGRATRVTFASPMAAAADAAGRDAASRAAADAAGRDAASRAAADVAGRGAASRAAADVVIAGDQLAWRGAPVIAVGDIRLRGAHNLENVMAAAAVTLARGVDRDAVRAALARFAGVEHRLEEVDRVDGVLYVDDSKATNVASAVVGIRSFPRGVHAILGGRGKQEDYGPLAAALAEHGRAAYLVGEEAGAIATVLAPAGITVRRCGDMERAVAAARAAAAPGEVVLLSPACASYDQYRSFGERGDHFKALVRA
jgi:UDP-N-acetylmuramoylalanine--D-glutamate ligase